MRKRLAKIVFFTALLTLLLASPVKAEILVSDITSQIMCMCGCGTTVSNCVHAECGIRDAMTLEAKQMIDSGLSADAIIQNFVRKYGEQVLAEPTKKGFNLTAWITPFAAIVVGGVVIYIAIRRWVKRGESEPVEETITGNEDEYRSRVEQELNKFGEGGFR